MNILLVSATKQEIDPFLSEFDMTSEPFEKKIGDHSVRVLITGAGMVATAFSMGKHLAGYSYDLAVNAGIAGSFDFNLPPGEVCQVSEDVFAELGAEDGDDFLSIETLGFGKSCHFASPNTAFTKHAHLKEVKAITVNKIHGNELSIAKAMARFKPQIESMEGAAFFYACDQSGTDCIQIRAISNYVERRNRENWKIGLAISNLNNTLIQLFNS